MSLQGRSLLRVVHLTILISFLAGIGIAEAKIVVPPSGSVIEVDVATLKAVVETFEQAEEAIKTHDLAKVMALYSPQYNYHGLKKDDLRKIWKELFDEYSEIASTHLFTKMTKVERGRTPCWKSPVLAISGPDRRPAVCMCPSTAGMKKYIISSLKTEHGVFVAMWVNHHACFRLAPRHIHSSDRWVGKVVT